MVPLNENALPQGISAIILKIRGHKKGALLPLFSTYLQKKALIKVFEK